MTIDVLILKGGFNPRDFGEDFDLRKKRGLIKKQEALYTRISKEVSEFLGRKEPVYYINPDDNLSEMFAPLRGQLSKENKIKRILGNEVTPVKIKKKLLSHGTPRVHLAGHNCDLDYLKRIFEVPPSFYLLECVREEDQREAISLGMSKADYLRIYNTKFEVVEREELIDSHIKYGSFPDRLRVKHH